MAVTTKSDWLIPAGLIALAFIPVAAGIARIDFRTFYGYGLVFAAIWFVIGALVFTFAPC